MFADMLVGNDGENVLRGKAGNDILDGGAGDDILFGANGNDQFVFSAGSDTLDGGAGSDIAFFDGDQSEFGITDNGGGSWQIEHLATGDIDTLIGIETLHFHDGDMIA
jgi:serralysin